MFRVKLCGFMRATDVREAVHLRVDAIGFQMSMGKRRIDASTARHLVRSIPPWITPVGVFVNEPLSRLCRMVRSCRFQVVQLHGDESEEYARAVPVPVLKAVRLGKIIHPSAFQGYTVAAFLLDRYNPRLRGGTGVTFPWRWAGPARRLPAPFLLAGGLDPKNVARAIRTVRPFGVDAASGVESSPGVKDPRLMASFVKKARGTFLSLRN